MPLDFRDWGKEAKTKLRALLSGILIVLFGLPCLTSAQLFEVKMGTDMTYLPPKHPFDTNEKEPAIGEFFEKLPGIELDLRWMAGKTLAVCGPCYLVAQYSYAILYDFRQSDSPTREEYASETFGKSIDRNAFALGFGLKSQASPLGKAQIQGFTQATLSLNLARGEWTSGDISRITHYQPSLGGKLEGGLNCFRYLELSCFAAYVQFKRGQQSVYRNKVLLGHLTPAGSRTIPEYSVGIAIGLSFELSKELLFWR